MGNVYTNFGSLVLDIARVAGGQGSQDQRSQQTAPPRPVCIMSDSVRVCLLCNK